MQFQLLTVTTAFVAILAVSGCSKPQEAEDVRPVRTITIEDKVIEDANIITGQVVAHAYAGASFRLSGKLQKRFVSTGDDVKKDQILAQLDDTIEKENVTAAAAEISAAKAALTQAEALEKRAGILVQSKAVSQNDYDEALRQLKTAKAQLQGAEAKAKIAGEQLAYTQLKAEQDGLVVERFAEEGEVVAAGQPVFRIAYNGARDAVFDVPEEIIRKGLDEKQKIQVCLDSDRSLCAEALVREIAPEADATTRTYQVKAIIEGDIPQLLLGATLVGRFTQNQEGSAYQIPATALSSLDGKPSVWVIDPAKQTVAMRSVEIKQYTTDAAILSGGVQAGEQIVTAGVQALHNGQRVRILENAHDVP